MKPRLGFLGAGWIGRHRMLAIAASGLGAVEAVADPSPEAQQAVQQLLPGTPCVGTLDDLLVPSRMLDAIVIATPSALHAEQAIRCLQQGIAVFCQKPLARTAPETLRIVRAARQADCRLGVDFSYRGTSGLRHLRELMRGGALGDVYAMDLVFHNAYGPDKPWFYDARLSGGGCAIDLGTHLVDLATWLLDDPVSIVWSRLFSQGAPMEEAHATLASGVDDYATAELEFLGGASARLACSWKLSAGRACEIRVTAYGTHCGACFSNVDGSFYDFVLDRYEGTHTRRLISPPDEWGGRMIVEWVQQLAQSPGYDPAVESVVDVARVIDAIYGREADVRDAVRAEPTEPAASSTPLRLVSSRRP